jgi:dihydropyrimidinase
VSASAAGDLANVAAIVGGTVVTPDGIREADVLISGERISGIGRADAHAGEQIDATGCYVLPGGVDPHTHLMAQVPLASAAAAAGGTTTALSFTNPDAGQADLDALHDRRAQLDGGGLSPQRPVIDIGLHAMLYDPDHATAADLAAARRAGASAVKVFLAYPELGIMCSPSRLLSLMTEARRHGLLVQVHCENGPMIETLLAGALQAGQRGARVFADTRPSDVEAEAVASALTAASLSGAPCYLVHLSSAAAIDQVRVFRKRLRSPVYAETCLHYLLLDDRDYATAQADRYLVCPPLRSRQDVEELWGAVADGTIDAIGSDHCQTRSAVPAEITGGTPAGYGLGGIGARLPLLLSEGLARGVPIERLVQLAAASPARIFGHYPRKGALAPGSDADIVVFDPAGDAVLGEDAFADGTGASVYAGVRQRGTIRTVLLRGHVIASGGKLTGAPPAGRYLPASPPPAEP